MSRELDILAHEYKKKPATVIRKDISLYRANNIRSTVNSFLMVVENLCKKEKPPEVIFIAIISKPLK